MYRRCASCLSAWAQGNDELCASCRRIKSAQRDWRPPPPTPSRGASKVNPRQPMTAIERAAIAQAHRDYQRRLSREAG